MVDSLYIHIPFCLSKCKYCDFFSVVCEYENRKSLIPDAYITALTNEIAYRLKQNNVTNLSTIYIGGGTPSLLSESQLFKIFDSITKFTAILPTTEITIEVNPDDVTENLLKMYENLYINRISCGIQSLNDSALQFCGRRADSKTNQHALELFAKYWKKQLSIDLICGLPLEEKSTFIKALKKIISYNPEHISMYSLTIEDETPLGKMYTTGKLNYDFDSADSLWLEAKQLLQKNGYAQYEVSNFCKEGKMSNHNLRYWNHQDYLGCGSGATGTIYFDNGTGERWTNSANIKKYCNFWCELGQEFKSDKEKSTYEKNIPQEKEFINLSDSKFEFFMMGLRKTKGINSLDYEKIFGESMGECVINLFKKWEEKKLAEITENSYGVNYRLNENGLLFLNKFISEIEL